MTETRNVCRNREREREREKFGCPAQGTEERNLFYM